MTDERKKVKKVRRSSRRRKRKKLLLLTGVPVLMVVAAALLLSYIFVFSIREIQIANKTGEGGRTTYIRYTEDLTEKLEVSVQTDNSLASKAVTYVSADPDIAEVSEDGVITAKNPGDTVITVKSKYNPWVSAEYPITVIQKALSMQVAMPEELPANEYYYLVHTGDRASIVTLPDPANGMVENLSYESTDPEVAIVNDDGVIEAYKGGITQVTVKWVGPYTEGEYDVLGTFWLNVCRSTDHDTLSEHEVQWYEESCLIAHALGNAGEYTYTNTLDALEESVAEGYIVLEVDLALTSDEEVVCRHTWYDDEFGVSYDGTIPDLATFESEKYYGTLTTLTAAGLLEYWQEHPELYFVTDTKQDENAGFLEIFEKLVDLAEEMGCLDLFDHLIVQLYDVDDYDKINEIYEVKHWLFTTYQLPEDEDGLEIEAAAFSAEHGFGVLTVPAWCMANDYYIDLADEYGLCLFVHTVDMYADVERSAARGIYGFYSDMLVPNDPYDTGE